MDLTPSFFQVFVSLSSLALLARFGLLPQPFLSLFAFIAHYTQKKGIFKAKHKRKFNFNEVQKGLFVGTQPRGKSDLNTLKKYGVNAIVAFNEEFELYVPSSSSSFHNITQKQLEEFFKTGDKSVLPEKKPYSDFLRLHMSVPDYQGPDLSMLATGVKFIDQQLSQGNKVFVHCNGGKGRSVALVVAYLLAKGEKGSEQSYKNIVKEVKKRRPQASKSLTMYPISSQARYLKEFEEVNKKEPVLSVEGLVQESYKLNFEAPLEQDSAVLHVPQNLRQRYK